MTNAEGVAQETWLRWSTVDHAEVRDARCYLIRITTRLAIDELRHQRRLRENYVGPCLPEPVSELPATDASAEVAESISLAMLVVLEAQPARACRVHLAGEEPSKFRHATP